MNENYSRKKVYERSVATISVVNFKCVWGDKEENLRRILGYTEALAKRGSEIIVFPETALVGYENERTVADKARKMQARLAEPIPGPSTEAVAALTKKYGVYVAFGMSELGTDGLTYNAAAVCGPDGVIGSYRKIHLPKEEVYWANRGQAPLVIPSPWGPIGIGICYDSYFFPELIRYYRAKGARLYLNPTIVCQEEVPGDMCRVTLEANVIQNNIFIASAGMAGKGAYNFAIGGSSIIGPSTHLSDVHYYAGKPFHAPGGDEEEVFTATIDLALADNVSDWNLYCLNDAVGAPDFRPELYQQWNQEILDDHNW